MHDIQRMERQIALLVAAQNVAEKQGVTLSVDAAAALVMAARIEEFCEDFTENIHRAGEGI